MKVDRRALDDINAGLVSDRRVLFSQAVFDVVNHRSFGRIQRSSIGRRY